MQVRAMHIHELEPVIDLHLEGLDQELQLLNQVFPGKQVDYSGRDQLTQLLQQVLQSGEGEIFIAVDENIKGDAKYVGYCLVTKKVYPVEEPKICGCINGIYVKDGYKRKGLGQKLFDKSLNWLRQEKVTYLELYHMINDPRAKAFWEKMGFTKVQYNCARKL